MSVVDPELNERSKWMPLYLSSIAGLSTCIGAGIVFMYPKGKPVSPEMMAFSLAMAGSVMVTVSLVSIGPECILTEERDLISGMEFAQRLFAFGLGSALYFCLSWCAFPEPDEILGFNDNNNSSNNDGNKKSHETGDDGGAAQQELTELKGEVTLRGESSSEGFEFQNVHSAMTEDASSKVTQSSTLNKRRVTPAATNKGVLWSHNKNQTNNNYDVVFGSNLETKAQKRAWRVALILFVSLLCHNFPEGLAVAASALSSTRLGLTVMFGIMIHNIPEGIAIAVPCLQARPNQPWLAFVLASVSGLAEPLGAWFALVVLKWEYATEDLAGNNGPSLGNVLSFVAGIMITVSFCELFPEGKRHCTIKSSSSSSSSSEGQDHENEELLDREAEIRENHAESETDPKEAQTSDLVAYNTGLVCGCVIMIITELIMEV